MPQGTFKTQDPNKEDVRRTANNTEQVWHLQGNLGNQVLLYRLHVGAQWLQYHLDEDEEPHL